MPVGLLDAIVLSSIGDVDLEPGRYKQLHNDILSMSSNGEGVRCTILAYSNREHFENHVVFHREKALAITRSIYPFVAVQVRYDPDIIAYEKLLPMLTSLGLCEYSHTRMHGRLII